MQFQIPQFIETEDRIVGPFTLKQFIYLVDTVGVAAILFFVLDFIIWFFVAVPLAALGVALAFIKVNGRPFIGVVMSAARYYWEPRLYIWQQEHPKVNLETKAKEKSSLENIVEGIALKNAWQQVQTGSAASKISPFQVGATRAFAHTKERYEAFRKLSGERSAARRVDYR